MTSTRSKQPSRRQFVAGVAAVGVVALSKPRSAQVKRPAQAKRAAAPMGRGPKPLPLAPASAAVAAYFGPLRAGTQVGDFTIVAVHDVRYGTVPVFLEHAVAGRFQVDVLRRAPRAGIARTEQVSLFLSNRGNGSQATTELQGLGAMALAAALDWREREGAQVPALLTHAQRTEQHPGGAFYALG